MSFLKTQDFSLTTREIRKIKKQRCTPLNGSTVPPVEIIEQKSASELQLIAIEKKKVIL